MYRHSQVFSQIGLACEIPPTLQHFLDALHHHPPPPDGIRGFLLPSDHPLLRWMAAQAAQLQQQQQQDATTRRPQLRSRSLPPTGSADNARAANRGGRPRLIPAKYIGPAREDLKASGVQLRPRKGPRARVIRFLADNGVRLDSVKYEENYSAIDYDVIEPVEAELGRLSN